MGKCPRCAGLLQLQALTRRLHLLACLLCGNRVEAEIVRNQRVCQPRIPWISPARRQAEALFK